MNMAVRRSAGTSADTSPTATLAELAALGAQGDDDACLDYLRDLVFPAGAACPKCERSSRFHRVRGRSAYSCQHCGCHVYPTAGTIFRRSTTELRIWFRAIAIVSAQPGAVTAANLEGELGISRPTASRMLARIVPVVEHGPELLFTATAPKPGRAPRPAPKPLTRARPRPRPAHHWSSCRPTSFAGSSSQASQACGRISVRPS